jgi:hypothetical protein
MAINESKKGDVENKISPIRTRLCGFKGISFTVVDYAYTKKGLTYWNCVCNCGARFVGCGKSLKNGSTTSCGCRRKMLISKKRSLPNGESSFNSLYNAYRQGAIARKLCFNISQDKFREITKKDCFYCGTPAAQIFYPHKQYSTGGYVYNGIDRIDSSVGYKEGNMVPCCKHCNTMKWQLSIDDFFSHIIKIYMRHCNGK